MNDKLRAEAFAAFNEWRDAHGSEICKPKNQIMIWLAAVEWMAGQVDACHKDVERLVFQFDAVKAENAALRKAIKEAGL